MNTQSISPGVDLVPFFNQVLDSIFASYPTLLFWIKSLGGIFIGLSLILSLIFLIGIIYCVEQLKYIRKKEDDALNLKVVPAYEDIAPSESIMAKRWESVKTHITTDNPNDWRQAIIDADIILDDILNKMGYKGESVGEKLKRVAKGDFATLDDAWEAHKVRNQIAHEGSTMDLNHHEAKEAVARYKRVFEEFYYI